MSENEGLRNTRERRRSISVALWAGAITLFDITGAGTFRDMRRLLPTPDPMNGPAEVFSSATRTINGALTKTTKQQR